MEQEKKTYLARLKLSTEEKELPTPTMDTLEQLILAHLRHVPFENIDLVLGKPISLDIPHLYKKIVTDHRGGVCYELNTLFHWLLVRLKYKATLVGLKIREEFNTKGQFMDVDAHATIVVELDHKLYMVDVGWGGTKFCCKPLELTEEYTVSDHPNGQFQVGLESDGFYYVGMKEKEDKGESVWLFIGRFKYEIISQDSLESAIEKLVDPKNSFWPGGYEELQVVCKKEQGCLAFSLHASALKKHINTKDESSKEVIEEVGDLETILRVLKEHFNLQPKLSDDEELILFEASKKKEKKDDEKEIKGES